MEVGSLSGNRKSYEFPPVISYNAKGKLLKWKIWVCLAKNEQYVKNKIFMVITEPMLSSLNPQRTALDHVAMPKSYVAVIYTSSEYVGGATKKSVGQIIRRGKNSGKINETNVLTQAILEARSRYKEKTIRISHTPTGDVRHNEYIPPMLAANLRHTQEIHFSNYLVQKKLNGVRCVAFFNTVTNNVELYSRKNFKFTQSKIASQLKKFFAIKPRLYLDGELYLHKLPLQTISGIARSKRQNSIDLEFYVFDCFSPATMNHSYSQRCKELQELFSHPSVSSCKLIKLVKSQEAKSYDRLKKLFSNILRDEYEGLILRHKHYKYIPSFNGRRDVRAMLKWKPYYDEEFKIIGYKIGKGKFYNQPILICETDNGDQFKVTIDMTLEDGTSLLNNLKKFPNKYIGKMVTVEFEEWSMDHIPVRARIKSPPILL